MEPLTGSDPSAVRDFRLLARLGEGGMGQVYLAASPAGRFIALKVIQPQFAGDPEFIRRFRAEADAAQRVSGLYTAAVVAAGVDDRPPWLATAFVPGPSLREVVAAHGPLPQTALWRLSAGLAEALLAIHDAGLIHRDMKPGNVLLAADGPRVIDFGISRAAAPSSEMTAPGATIGTPSYMSPEQVEGAELGPASDVFSFGSVLAFAATGMSPFAGAPGASAPSVMFRVAHKEPALDGVPGDLREVVAACLAKDPARRPSLGQVAARSSAAVEHLGLSPAAFWPGDVARVIDAQAAALSRELTALRAGTQPYPRQAPHPQQAPAFPPPAAQPMTRAPMTRAPMMPGPTTQGPMPPTRPVRGGTGRRAFLIGGVVAGAAVLAGGGAYAVSALAGGKSGNARFGPGSLAWRFAANQQPNAPTVAGRLVYFGTGLPGAGQAPVYAVRTASSEQAWTDQSNMISVAPTVAGGVLCAVDATGTLYAAGAASGTQLWKIVTGQKVGAGEKTWDADAIHVALAPGDGSVVLYRPATGRRFWRAGSASVSWTFVAVPGTGFVYAYDDTGGVLSALDAASGAQLWHRQVVTDGTQSKTGLAVSGGAAFVGTQGGTLHCVDTATRQPRWSYQVPGASFPVSGLVAAGGLVYFTDDNGVLRALSAASGAPQWHAQVGTSTSPAPLPAVADGKLYIPAGSALQQFDATSGAVGWSYTLPNSNRFTSSAAADGGLVFAAGTDLGMYAIRA